MDWLIFDFSNHVFQRKPKILPAQVPSIQVPQEGPLSHSSVVSTGLPPDLLTSHHWLHILCGLCFFFFASHHETSSVLSVPRAPPVCVYVNKHGNCGPHLDRKQMQHLPDHFGPGPVNSVLQQVVQSCIDCAYQPKILLSALQTHAGGGEVVRGIEA